jgi:predicted neuraminidase
MSHLAVLKLIAGLLIAGSPMQSAATSQFIFTSAPFASAHASNIVQLRNGDFLASWFGGSAEGKPDVAIWASRFSSGHWSTPFEMARETDIACYNPVMFYTRDGRLWFYYKFGPHPSSWSAGRRWSDDDGKNWSEVEHLPAGLYGPIRAKPLVLEDGTVVSGSSVESYHSWACWIERSTDNGKTWKRIGPITVPQNASDHANASRAPYGIIQPSVISLGGGRLRLYARSTSQIGHVCMADSADSGLTWTQARPIAVPNPNSGIDAVRLKDGRIVLVYNNTTTGRTPLNLAVSEDAEHFRMFKTLEDEPGEYSYPAMIQGREGDLHITYTWNRKRIRYVRIPLADIPHYTNGFLP